MSTDKLTQLVVDGISNGTINNVSFKSLNSFARTNGIKTNNTELRAVRESLVNVHNLAVVDSTGKLLLTNGGAA